MVAGGGIESDVCVAEMLPSFRCGANRNKTNEDGIPASGGRYNYSIENNLGALLSKTMSALPKALAE
jgi:hypothetical protein